MITIACPVCRTQLPSDVDPTDPFACPDCGDVTAISHQPPAAVAGTTWGLALVVMCGVVTGFMGYFVTAKHIAPALKTPSAQRVAGQ